SVALLHALAALRRKFHFELTAAHLNHALRAGESDRDEAFVLELCGRLDVPLTVERARGLKRSEGNLEARARTARQRFLARVAEGIGADYIALAHQADDQAETVMLRLLRGAGVTGLGAMAELSGKLIRPLLEVRRAAILAYLKESGAQFVEDSTNASLAHDRNRVRHRLMPLLEREFAPGLTGRLADLAAEMRQVDDLLGTLADQALKDCLDDQGALGLDRLKRLHPALVAATLRRFLAVRVGNLFGFERAHIEAVQGLCLKGPPNGRIVLPDGWLARRRYGKLLLVRGEDPRDCAISFAVPLAVEGVTVVAQARVIFESALVPRAQAPMPHDASEAVFDAQGVSAGLSVRNFNPGDRIAPLGVPGSRKVKDVFIDNKIPPQQRSRFPVVWLGECVAWLPGLVRSKVALVTETTAEVMRLTVKSEHCVEFKPRASVY
ncbi:MAG TPA: tRNA lysidine(34) synthetase TilS, partial [Candidatus Binataceae bacterium]|nr:tRNA lysidine(34) synthetase TilS [Candidatus Binataceae bacterium]